MAFFENLGKTLSGAAEKVADKAKELGDLAGIKADMLRKESAVKAELLELGELAYNTEKDQAESPYREKCAKITAIYKEIDALKKQYDEARDKEDAPEKEPAKVCAACGAEQKPDAEFCDKCGAALPK